MKKLLDLQLSIPTIDELTSRKLMGGDGYAPPPEPDGDGYVPLPEPEYDYEVNIPEIEIIGEDPGVPNAPETESEIPDSDMDPIEGQDRTEPEQPDSDDDQDQDRSGENGGENGGNNQGNTGNEGGSGGYPDWADVIMSHIFGPLQEYAKNLNLNFLINPALPETTEAQYNATTNTVILRNDELSDHSIRSLTHELIHAVQDNLGQTDAAKSNANIEFQAHLLTDIMMCYCVNGMGGNSVVTNDLEPKYSGWLFDITDCGDESTPFNVELFKSGWEEYMPSFNERYNDVSGYQGINEQYDWKWDEILEALFSDLTDAQPPLFIPAGD